jgi:trans-2,3-dihydro-3-hydroxyanthranilate isomerase
MKDLVGLQGLLRSRVGKPVAGDENWPGRTGPQSPELTRRDVRRRPGPQALASGAARREHRGMGRVSYRLCDVFTERALAGNALAVFSGAEDLDGTVLQALAREMNLSESAFVLPPTLGGADARIRIFTPTMELPFAGHPTLGSAFVLGEGTAQDPFEVRLQTERGISTVRLSAADGASRFGWMTQPLPHIRAYEHTSELLAALGVGASSSPVELYDNGPHYVLVELARPEAVAALSPDMTRLAALGSIAVSVFARQAEGWKVRVFAPGEGISEDPATGAAAGPLALHLARHARIRFGDRVLITQGAEVGRPSTLHARVTGSAERLELVEVGGNAVVIGGGVIELPDRARAAPGAALSDFESRFDGAFLCLDGPARRRGERYSNKKLCFTSTRQDLLARHLRQLARRDDCWFVKFSVCARGGMYLGRCFLTSDDAVGATWALYKNHPTLFCTVQDDDFTGAFRERCLTRSEAWLDEDRERSPR